MFIPLELSNILWLKTTNVNIDQHKVAHNCEAQRKLYMIELYFTNKKLKSQSFVEPHCAVITAGRLLGNVSTSFAHLETHCPFFFAKQLKFSQIKWRAFVNGSVQILPQILDLRSSVLWLSHSDTWEEVLFSTNPLALCLAFLSCWKVTLHPVSSFVDSNRFSCKIAQYLATSISPSTLTIFPFPAEEKHTHCISDSLQWGWCIQSDVQCWFLPQIVFCI